MSSVRPIPVRCMYLAAKHVSLGVTIHFPNNMVEFGDGVVLSYGIRCCVMFLYIRSAATEGQQLLRLVTLPETRGRVIVKVCIAPSNDNVVAVATSEGTVVALMLNIEDRNLREKTLSVVEHHRRANTAVTAVCWSMVPQHAVVETLVSPRDDEGLTHMRLFSGDAKGNVYVTEVEIRSQNRLFRPFADSSVMKRKVTSCLVRCGKCVHRSISCGAYRFVALACKMVVSRETCLLLNQWYKWLIEETAFLYLRPRRC